jgi:hypothetical protein
MAEKIKAQTRAAPSPKWKERAELISPPNTYDEPIDRAPTPDEQDPQAIIPEPKLFDDYE